MTLNKSGFESGTNRLFFSDLGWLIQPRGMAGRPPAQLAGGHNARSLRQLFNDDDTNARYCTKLQVSASILGYEPGAPGVAW
jgi:hypothetical protein